MGKFSGTKYESTTEDTNGVKKKTPSYTPRAPGRDDGYSGGIKYTGENTYNGPANPSEGRSDGVSDRPAMSKKWIEK